MLIEIKINISTKTNRMDVEVLRSYEVPPVPCLICDKPFQSGTPHLSVMVQDTTFIYHVECLPCIGGDASEQELDDLPPLLLQRENAKQPSNVEESDSEEEEEQNQEQESVYEEEIEAAPSPLSLQRQHAMVPIYPDPLPRYTEPMTRDCLHATEKSSLFPNCEICRLVSLS